MVCSSPRGVSSLKSEIGGGGLMRRRRRTASCREGGVEPRGLWRRAWVVHAPVDQSGESHELMPVARRMQGGLDESRRRGEAASLCCGRTAV